VLRWSVEILSELEEMKQIPVSVKEYPSRIMLPVFPSPAYISKEKYENGIEVIEACAN
jgi:hypothetical protein